MTFRTRLIIGSLAVAVIPLGAFGLAARRQVTDRVIAQYEERVALLVANLRDDVARQGRMVTGRLTALAENIVADNRFRLGIVQGGDGRAYVLDYAADRMRLSGLDMLQIQDESGRIVSSGHFRNEYDLLDGALPRLLEATPDGTGLVRVRTPAKPFLALARLDSFHLGPSRFTLVGGVTLDEAFLRRLGMADQLDVAILLPSDTVAEAGPPSDGVVVAELQLPYIASTIGGESGSGTARIVVAQSTAPLDALRRTLDRWLALALGASAAIAALLAVWTSSRIGRPLAELAEKTARVDLDRLDIEFTSQRGDEIGALTRLLGTMTERLRASVRTLREVERRAAVGDLARQVNHDIKNGLTPIRNVFRHLAQVSRDRPEQLAAVFRERQGTLESAVEYLEKLAASYASLSPRFELRACDANAVVRRVVHGMGEMPVPLRLELADSLPAVRADELALRRVVENLVRNAVDAAQPGRGGVTVSSEIVRRDSQEPAVKIGVRDNGPGMTREELHRAFSDFYTTKTGGTGLGLSIVRRLVTDFGGSLKVETGPGHGTRFTVELPAATTNAPEAVT